MRDSNCTKHVFGSVKKNKTANEAKEDTDLGAEEFAGVSSISGQKIHFQHLLLDDFK